MNEAQVERQETEIDLYELFTVFLDHIKFIIVWFLVGALVAGLITFFLITPTYQSTAKMYIVSTSNNSLVDLTDLSIGTSLTKDYEELILSDPVMERVANELNTEYTTDQIKKMVSVANPPDTRVLSITAVTPDPTFSRDLANTVMNISMEYLPETMSTTAPNIAQKAKTPKHKYAPSNSKNTLIGALLGFLIACAWLTIQYIRDDTIHTAEDMELHFGITPLTTVPESDKLITAEDLKDKDKKKKKKLFRKRGKKA